MKIQLKRSNVLDGGVAKEPTAVQMEYGELAVNYNTDDPAIFLKDSNDNIIRIAGALGDITFPEAGGGPHQPGTSDDRYVEVNGDNMTGNLTLGTDKITLNASTGKVTSASTVESDLGTTLVTKDYLKAQSPQTPPVTTSDTAPAAGDSEDGDLWWDSSDGSGPLYVYYDDGNSSQWVEASPQGEGFTESDADGRYLRTDAEAGNQKVNSTGVTSFAGDVGIGTDSALSKLHVESEAATEGWQIRTDSVGLDNESGFYRDADDNYQMVLRNGLGGLSMIKNTGQDTTANLVMDTQGQERLRIDSVGNVGIGTDTPQAMLDVNGSIRSPHFDLEALPALL